MDGLLDDPAWSRAEAASGFRQREPREGAAATEATEVRVLYDETTLYVGVRALDRRPQEVIARILQRDRVIQAGIDNQARWAGDDGVAILLDPFHDHRNAFLFATNPNGAEFDALVTDESASYNADWRGVWRVAARRTAEGWSAEFAIPFRSLRYPSSDGEPALGLQRRAVHPPQERGDPVERLVAGGGRTPPGEPRRPPGGPRLACLAPASTSRSSPTGSWARARSARTTGPSPGRRAPPSGATSSGRCARASCSTAP